MLIHLQLDYLYINIKTMSCSIIISFKANYSNNIWKIFTWYYYYHYYLYL